MKGAAVHRRLHVLHMSPDTLLPDSPLMAHMVILLLAIGGVGGFLSGLLGVGGGILFVPALFFCLSAMGVAAEHAMHVAVGSSLAIICVTGASSALSHWRRGSVDTDHIRLWVLPLMSGVGVGAVFAGFVDSYILRVVFAAVTTLICFYMMFSPQPKTPDACLIVPRRIQKVVMAFIGVMASLIGVGGAVMTVPFMHLMGFPMPRAAGTGSALGMIIAVPGTLFYMITGLVHHESLPPYSIGYINGLAVGIIIPVSVLAAPLGVQAAHSLSRDMLRRVFAIVLLLVSVRMFMTL